jgi:hypothetical protein
MNPKSDSSERMSSLKSLSLYLTESTPFLDYPFESICKVIDVFGNLFADNTTYDDLIDQIALLSEKRNSELAAGEVYIRRGGQKLSAKLYQESVVYFGKAVVKLAKEESNYGMYLCLIGLSRAYEQMGLIWASNDCLVSAASISIKSWYEKGKVSKKVYHCVKQLCDLELMTGRIPLFLAWHELLLVLGQHLNEYDGEETNSYELIDACLVVRLLNTDYGDLRSLSLLPDLLETQNLWLSQNAVLHWLGYDELIIDDYKKTDIKDEEGLSKLFQMSAEQPFKKQMIFNTDFLDSKSNKISSRILGCFFNVHYADDKEVHMAAETIMAYLESFLATSLKDVFPSVEQIEITLVKNETIESLKFSNDKASNEYTVELSRLDFKGTSEQNKFWEHMLEFTSNLLGKNFIIKDTEEYLTNLFKKEEVHERISMVFEHRKLLVNILGDNPKVFYNDWVNNKSFKTYSLKRDKKIEYSNSKIEISENEEHLNQKPNFNNATHNNQRVSSIIDVSLWDSAKWKGFGFFGDAQGMGIFLAFENGEVGKQIFDNWIKTFGIEDKNGDIRLAIIKGINKVKPHWYNVHVSKELEGRAKESGDFFISASRYNEITPENPTNLNNLIMGWEMFKKYRKYSS